MKFTVLCCMLCVSCFLQVAVKRLRVLDLDKVGAPNEQYGAGGSSDSAQSSGDVDGSQRAMGASQAAFRQFFEREIAILASIRHPNVVNFIGELGVFESRVVDVDEGGGVSEQMFYCRASLVVA